ncbi:nucleotidyl transferase AbiEii/AbiGii toxin family protein [Microbacterium lacticum]
MQNQARRQKRGTQELLTMYIVERWLSRMSRSPYAEDFILKGGMLLASFGTRRPTVDADALARNMASDEETVARRVAEIAAIEDSDVVMVALVGRVSVAAWRATGGVAGALVVLMCVARVALAVHYVSDVTAGVCLAVVWVLVARLLWQRLSASSAAPARSR